MAVFPAINSGGVRAHYPNEVSFEHLTSVTNLPAGPRAAYAWRSEPLGRYTLNLKGLTDAETATIEAFFVSMQGRFGSFIYVDPTGNLLNYSEDFTQAVWTKACTVGASTADPFGGTAATLLVGDSSGNSFVSEAVAIDPGVAGSLACFSVYLRAVSVAGPFNLTLTDGTTTVNQACTLQTGAWTRVSVPWTFGSSGGVTVKIGGGSTWTGTNQIAVFGPMLGMTPGAEPYVKTPGCSALRLYCRFDQDAFDVNYQGPNNNNITLKIVEYTPGPFDIQLVSAHLSIVSSYDPGPTNAIEFLSDWYITDNPYLHNETYTLTCLKVGGSWAKETDVYDISPGSPPLGYLGVTPPFTYVNGNLGYDNSSLGALLSTLCLTFCQLNSSGGPAGTSHYSVYGAYLDVVLLGGANHRYWASAYNYLPSRNGYGDVTNPQNAVDGNLADCAVINGYQTGNWDPAWLQLFGWV